MRSVIVILLTRIRLRSTSTPQPNIMQSDSLTLVIGSHPKPVQPNSTSGVGKPSPKLQSLRVWIGYYTSTVHELPRCMYTRIWSMVLSSEQVGQDIESLNSVAFNGLSPSRVWSHLVEDFDIHSWPGRSRGHATIYSTRYTHQRTLLCLRA